jgi:hypothetical protein
MDDFSDIRGRLSFPKNPLQAGFPQPFFVRAASRKSRVVKSVFATSDNACYVAFAIEE